MRPVSSALPTLSASRAAGAALGAAYGRVAAVAPGGRGPVAPVAAVAAARQLAPPGGEVELAVRTFAHGGSATILRRLVGGVTVGIDALVR